MVLDKGSLIAIIRGISTDAIVPIANAVVDGGVNILEVSLSEREQGLNCLETLREKGPEHLVLGAGTVTTPGALDAAVAAGAEYIITPAFDAALVQYAQDKKVPIFPGVYSPADVMQALNMGVNTVKLFPAANLGAGYVKSLLAPFPQAQFIGVGGIHLGNMAAFWDAGCHRFALGSNLVKAGETAKDAAAIKERTKNYISFVNILKNNQ